MSNFPHNNDKDRGDRDEEPNGTPLGFYEMRAFADKILFWHTNNRTGDFSESGDGFWDGVNYLTLGLLELLSDPNAIHRLMTTGQQVKRDIDVVTSLGDSHELTKRVNKVLNEVFKEETE